MLRLCLAVVTAQGQGPGDGPEKNRPGFGDAEGIDPGDRPNNAGGGLRGSHVTTGGGEGQSEARARELLLPEHGGPVPGVPARGCREEPGPSARGTGRRPAVARAVAAQ